MAIRITRLLEYPIKGLPALRHDDIYSVPLSPYGRVGLDRRWWFTLRGTDVILNGKWACRERFSRFFRICAAYYQPEGAAYDQPVNSVSLWLSSSVDDQFVIQSERFSLDRYEDISGWLSQVCETELDANTDDVLGCPDDRDNPSFTLLSEATARAVAQRFDWTVVETIARLRPNVVITGVDAFEEYSFLGKVLRIGSSRIRATQACTRCSVLGAHPSTGVISSTVPKEFGEWMAPQLQKWAPPGFQREPHGYYAALNTQAIEIPQGSTIAIGRHVEVE